MEKGLRTLQKVFLPPAVFLLPLAAFAAPPANFKELINRLIDIFNQFAVLFVSLAVLLFVWGVVKYVRGGGDEKKVAEGRLMIVNGIIALFVILAFFLLALVIYNSLFS